MKRKMTLYIPMAKTPVDYEKMTIDVYSGRFRDFKKIDEDQCRTWKHLLTVTRPCNAYESGLVSIYRTSRKEVFAIKTYYDGCFWPYVCYTRLTDEILKAIDDLWVFLNKKNSEVK